MQAGCIAPMGIAKASPCTHLAAKPLEVGGVDLLLLQGLPSGLLMAADVRAQVGAAVALDEGLAAPSRLEGVRAAMDARLARSPALQGP